MKNLLYILASICLPFFLQAQTKISGKILNEQNNAIEAASVILKDSLNQSIIKYTTATNLGKFEIELPEKAAYNLVVNALGYESKIVAVTTHPSNLNLNIHLKEKNTELEEVIITTEKPISVRNDTISFKTKFFTNGTEQNVEDLLKKIPGLNIEDNGTIKIGDREVEKIMVDGDDFFNKGYKVLSKNMPAYPVEEVEVLKNYSNNKHLKGIENSDKVALNLKLDEKSKNLWFGNAEIGLANHEFYKLKTNLMNFGKKSKYYFLANANNIGVDAIGDISHIIKPFSLGEPGTIVDDVKTHKTLNLRATVPGFNTNKANFNNAKLVSLNAIFNPSNKLKIKPLVFLNWDKLKFYKNYTEQVAVQNTQYINTENYSLQNQKQIAFGKVDFIYDFSKIKTLESTTSFNFSDFKDKSHLVFNTQPTTEGLKHNNQLFDQKFKYTNKFQDKKVFILSSRFINEKAPQNYKVNQFYFQDLFPNQNLANEIGQFSENKLNYAGIQAQLLDRKEGGDLLELQAGNEFKQDELNSQFFIFENQNIVERPTTFSNQTIYTVNDLYVSGKYTLKIKSLQFASSVNLHQYVNKLTNNQYSKQQTPFVINPRFSAKWEINNKNTTQISYSHNTNNADILNVFDGYVATSFRSFNKGYGDFKQLHTSSYNFSYQFGNWTDRFFANINTFYFKNHDAFSSQSILNQNYILSNQIVVNNNSLFSTNSQLNYYFKKLSSNLKVNLGYNKSTFQNIINNSDYREVTADNYTYGLEVRSSFNGFFNFHFGSTWRQNSVKTTFKNEYTNTNSFLDLSFTISSKLNFNLQTERYYFGNLATNNTYYFLNANATYTVYKDKLTLRFTGNNLTNTTAFTNYSVSDFSVSTTQYKLLPAYYMLSCEFRF